MEAKESSVAFPQCHVCSEWSKVYYSWLRWNKECSKKAEEYKSRYNVDIIPGDGSNDELNSSYLPEADIIFCAARAGTQVIALIN